MDYYVLRSFRNMSSSCLPVFLITSLCLSRLFPGVFQILTLLLSSVLSLFALDHSFESNRLSFNALDGFRPGLGDSRWSDALGLLKHFFLYCLKIILGSGKFTKLVVAARQLAFQRLSRSADMGLDRVGIWTVARIVTFRPAYRVSVELL